MALALSTTSPDTLWTTTTTTTQVTLAWRTNVNVRICAPSTADVYVVRDTGATDGGALGALPYARIPAGSVDYLPIGSGSLFLAASAAGAVATISIVPSDNA